MERSEAPGQADPRMLYRGGDDRLFLSGLRDGTYRLRVRARSDGAWTGWSEPLELSVRHHPLSRAVVFLGLGAVVFGLTAATIVAGDRKVRAASGADAGEGAR